MQLTLVGDVSTIIKYHRDIPTSYLIKKLEPKDQSQLALLYLDSYSRDIVADLEASEEEIGKTFLNEYGQLSYELSCVTLIENRIVSSILTVDETPWPDTPPGPFIIEVMTHPLHRRFGLAQAGICWVAKNTQTNNKHRLGLRVESGNLAAMTLYRKIGLREWRTE